MGLAGCAMVSAAALAQADPVGDVLRMSQPALQPAPGQSRPDQDLPEPAPENPALPSQTQSGQPVPLIPETQLARPSWALADARALLGVIEGIGAEGLEPADYRPDALRAAIAAGAGPELDGAITTSLRWLIEDLRDGRTPMSARRQWFVVDPDAEALPTEALIAELKDKGGIAGLVERLAPVHPDYARLREELAVTPPEDAERRALIRANMDRWRWLPRDLGPRFLRVNVPEFQLRLNVGGKVIRTYRTIVGKPGRTATPQLMETATGIIFNPTWTVPQSIVRGEGLGARLLANPASARARGYKVTRGADGTVHVVQQPGPNNSLGLMKIDMPNPHAIFLHDTPAKQLFDTQVRAYSHGCIRVERATELAITLAILHAGLTPEEGVAHTQSGVYTRVPFTSTFPVYISYFTMGQDVDGQLATFPDLYERDGPVLESLAKPRQQIRPRTSTEKVEELGV